MRFVRLLAAAAALACSGLAGQAQAAKLFTISGSASAPSDINLPGLIDWNAHRVTGVRISFSAPASGWFSAAADGTYYAYLHGNLYDANDTMIGIYAPFTNARSIAGTAGFQQGSASPFYGLPTYFHWNQSSAALHIETATAPVSYTITTFGAVPEPATWALMILGFGGIGAALRRSPFRIMHSCPRSAW